MTPAPLRAPVRTGLEEVIEEFGISRQRRHARGGPAITLSNAAPLWHLGQLQYRLLLYSRNNDPKDELFVVSRAGRLGQRLEEFMLARESERDEWSTRQRTVDIREGMLCRW